MDKRQNPRYAIELNALVHPQVGRSWLCTIRDFCNGGMLLVEQETGRVRSTMPGINPGETVGIHYSVPTQTKDLHFRLEGQIIRVMHTGVGIKFHAGMDDDAITALLNYSNSRAASLSKPKSASQGLGSRDTSKQPARVGGFQKAEGNRTFSGGVRPATEARAASTDAGSQQGESTNENIDLARDGLGGGQISPADAKKIIRAIRREVTKVLPDMNSGFFSYMDNELLKLARDSKSNAEQSEYFAAMSNLEKAKKQVAQAFTQEVVDQIDNPRGLRALLEERRQAEADRKKKRSDKVRLSLVNTDEFEDWLAVANLISRSERSYDKYLQEIQARLGMLVDSWSHNEANPLGTAVFCHAFDNAIRTVDLSKEIRQKVYTGFEAKAVPMFRKFYISVTKLLEDSKVFPDLDDDYIRTSSTVSARQIVNDDPKVVEEKEKEEPTEKAEPVAALKEESEDEVVDDRENLLGELRELKEELKGRDGRKAGRRSDDRPADRRGGGSRAAIRRASGRRASGEAASMGDIFSTVRNLMKEEPQYEDDQDYIEIDEVQDLLRTLQNRSEPGQRLNVRQQLIETASRTGVDRRIAPEALESMAVVENLVDTIEDDSMLSSSAKDWIRQLELTLDKVATDTGNIFDEDNPHPALDVINQLARLGGAESGSIRRDVEHILEDINSSYDENPEIFDLATKKLQPLLERQSRAFTGNVQRTVKASEGKQTLVNAQRAVVDELDSRFSGREVPDVLMKLLMPGWRNLMVNTHLRQGQESSDWKRQVQALDQVFHHLGDTANPVDSEQYIEPENLLDEIEQGLDSISFEPGQRVPLLNSLRQLIVEGGSRENVKMVAMPKETFAEAVGLGNVSQQEVKREQILAEKSGDNDWKLQLDRAARLHVGEWVEFKDLPEQNQISIVAWANEEHGSYVFVNRKGVKTNELMTEELASMFFEQTAKILDESEIPLTDRASHRMLQNMHNQLTHQATHDELTGLINRKEFERELARALASAKKQNIGHIVAYFDLDQFKVINNAAGYDAGDALIKELGGLLASHLEGSQFILSRLGGDEFGVLIEGCKKESGLTVVKKLFDEIKRFQFKWNNDSFKLTTSCGVVYLDADTESVSAILQGADSACYAAKDAGRDRLQIYEAGDSEMEHRRDVMEFVSQIDYALENDRFILNCQKIAPIVENGVDHAHYEILLTVLDENNEPMPPQDFIVAAETYNRMGAIDRWVIKNAFKFIAENILKLDGLGAFSINISGNSLTEDDFMEFVLEQFNLTKLPTSMICFEITETSAIGSLDSAIEFMEKLKIIGVQFSLDDFGTGLSSYSYLRNLPVDYLKIDGIFVRDIKTNPNDYAVVKSINEIGHFMGKKTIAEYVEDDEVLEILRDIGVDFAQGFGIEKKLPITHLLG
ncbi:MAG: diguanylate cyclase (GGDEF)-like protein [Candidatus Azotimanducaceae bacterium]|jgi:diguanylate cyclase (GGDEF)-like protein